MAWASWAMGLWSSGGLGWPLTSLFITTALRCCSGRATSNSQLRLSCQTGSQTMPFLKDWFLFWGWNHNRWRWLMSAPSSSETLASAHCLIFCCHWSHQPGSSLTRTKKLSGSHDYLTAGHQTLTEVFYVNLPIFLLYNTRLSSVIVGNSHSMQCQGVHLLILIW